MKLFAILFMSILILGSCQSEKSEPTKNTYFVGNVLGDDLESILFYADTLFKIVPIENGKFEFEIPARSEDYFLGIAARINRSYFYVTTGDTVLLNINTENFGESLYESLADPVNQYISNKEKKLKSFPIMNIDSSEISQKLDSLAVVLNQDFEELMGTNSLTISNKETEQLNINTELQKLDWVSKNVTGRKRPLSKAIKFDAEFMKSPKYLDFLDGARWGLADQRIEEDGKSANKMNLDELITYQLEEISEVKDKSVRSYLLFRALRSQIAMKGIEGIEGNLNLFNSGNSIQGYGQLVNQMMAARAAIKRGAMAKEFSYENEMGELVKLSDFRGKFVFIDVWATWCKPCIEEMPYLKEIEKSFSKEKIAFLAISIDEDKNKWKNFLNENNFEGIQLIADKAEESSIMKDYLVMNLPNYLLIDDEGALITVSAPIPSSGELKQLLEKELE